jgi:hypothetical protein
MSRIDRRQHSIDVAGLLARLGIVPAATISGVDVALVAPRSWPVAGITWTPTAYSSGTATLLLAGPDADSTGALVVSSNADLWIRVTDAPEVEAVKVERITVIGGGQTLVVTPPVSTLALVGSGLVDSSTIAA